MNRAESVLEIKARLTETGLLSFADEVFIRKYYESMTGKYFVHRPCANCYKDALIEMYVAVKGGHLKRDNRLYVLRRGKVLHLEGKSYTRQSITDEVSAKYLEQFPYNDSFFERIPKCKEQERRKGKNRNKNKSKP